MHRQSKPSLQRRQKRHRQNKRRHDLTDVTVGDFNNPLPPDIFFNVFPVSSSAYDFFLPLRKCNYLYCGTFWRHLFKTWENSVLPQGFKEMKLLLDPLISFQSFYLARRMSSHFKSLFKEGSEISFTGGTAKKKRFVSFSAPPFSFLRARMSN